MVVSSNKGTENTPTRHSLLRGRVIYSLRELFRSLLVSFGVRPLHNRAATNAPRDLRDNLPTSFYDFSGERRSGLAGRIFDLWQCGRRSTTIASRNGQGVCRCVRRQRLLPGFNNLNLRSSECRRLSVLLDGGPASERFRPRNRCWSRIRGRRRSIWFF